MPLVQRPGSAYIQRLSQALNLPEPPFPMSQDKIVLITGCTTGSIGHSLALEFDKRCCKVIATTRDPNTMLDLVNHPTIETLRMDVCDQTSIAAARDEVTEMTCGKLDVLFNNA
ncbi:hypothetical protein OF83DRAFT_250638 [Amylostereum chailletii]|nr:hypothetical protein OF83DRAFT_250638 [Amylostereum chailletii]